MTLCLGPVKKKAIPPVVEESPRVLGIIRGLAHPHQLSHNGQIRAQLAVIMPAPKSVLCAKLPKSSKYSLWDNDICLRLVMHLAC